MTNYAPRDPIDLVKEQITDAKLWAESFMDTCNKICSPIDEGLMISWFANAIMVMHDRLHNTKIRPLEAERDELEKKLAIAVSALTETVAAIELTWTVTDNDEFVSRILNNARKALEQVERK